MASIQLNFTLRTTATVKTVHLLGSWDNYQGQLPMSRDAAKKTSSGAWVGTFRFQPGTIQPGARYWYYYIMDGYHVTHDPAREAVVEPTTQRKLNILDIPASKATSTSSTRSSQRSSRRNSIPKGRSLSPSQIKCPRPQRPGQTASIANETYNKASFEEISARLGAASLSDSDDSDSDSDSDVPSLSDSRSSNSSSPSSLSSSSTSSCCTCERYGITRSGNRIKLDCGGSRCGYSDEDSCDESEEEEVYRTCATRRHGVVIRGQ